MDILQDNIIKNVVYFQKNKIHYNFLAFIDIYYYALHNYVLIFKIIKHFISLK